MSDDSLQEQLTQRIANSPTAIFLAAIVGVLLFLGAIGVLVWVEHTAITTAVSLEHGLAETVSVDPQQVNPANEGHLVHVTGEATAANLLSDPDFGIEVKALRLTREVEVYQWKESKKKSEKETAYEYNPDWSHDKPASSKGFHKPAGHDNVEKRDEDSKYQAHDVKLGAFTLPPSQVEQVSANEDLPIAADLLDKLPEKLKALARVTPDGLLFVGVEPESTPKRPQFGDERIRYKIAKSPLTISVVARQVGSTLEPYVAEGNKPMLKVGAHTKEAMFAAAQSSNQWTNWAWRGGALVALVLAAFLVIRRQGTVALGAPPEGIGFTLGAYLFATGIALSVMFLVIGVRWLLYQPLFGAGLLVAGPAALAAVIFGTRLVSPSFFATLQGKSKKWSPQERSYFRRIALDPDNAQLRLEFAGVLEKKGDPLGEFIRLSQQLEDLPPDDDRREGLSTRCDQIMQANGGAWYAPLRRLRLEPKLVGNFYAGLWMHHGIIDQVLIDLPGILPEKADQLFEAAPGLRILEFHNVHSLTDTIYNPDVPAIVEVPHLKQIGVLRMSSLNLKAGDLEAIASSPNLENLTELDFSYNKVGPEGAVAVAQSSTLKRLRVLDLRACDIGKDGAVALGASANLAHLVTLNLGANAIGPAGAKALAVCAHLKDLQTLALDQNNLGPTGAQMVAASPHFRQLTSLDLGYNEIGPDGALALARSANLAKVTTLKLNNNKLGTGLRFLAASPHLGQVTVLDLSSNEFDDAAATALAAGKVMLHLEELTLSDNNIGDAGIKALAAWPGLARLNKLNLQHNKIGAAGIAALAASPHLRGLAELNLGNNPVGVAGAKALAASATLANLKSLWIQETQLTSEGEKVLRKRFGDVVHLT